VGSNTRSDFNIVHPRTLPSLLIAMVTIVFAATLLGHRSPPCGYPWRRSLQ